MASPCVYSMSNQDLLKVLTGRSSLRKPELVEEELCSPETVQKLREGLSYYKPPSKKSANELRKEVKGHHLDFILLLSAQLTLDEIQCYQMFRLYLSGVYSGCLARLSRELGEEQRRGELVTEVCAYYQRERVHLLRCVHHLLGYWQDSHHPYQRAYRECLDKVDQERIIKWVWKQYKERAEEKMPASLKGEREESAWVMQSLRVQCLLLEIALLYYKDYHLPPSQLMHTIHTIQQLEFGSRQLSTVSLSPSTQAHITHLNHLSALLLVEVVDLELVQHFLTGQTSLQKHHLLAQAAESAVEEMDELLSGGGWGDKQCHAPFLLAWMLFKYTTQARPSDLEHFQPLQWGQVALQCGVFQYLLSILESPFFTGNTPLASLGKALVHTQLSVAITCFSETSLGDSQTLVAIATKSLTHPGLLLQFWNEEMSGGVGVLLSSAMSNFPHDTPFSFLASLSSHPHTAHSVTHYLLNLHTLTLELDRRWQVTYDEDGVVLTQSIDVFSEEAQQMGVAPLHLQAGTKGTLVPTGQRPEVVCWRVDCSAVKVFSFRTRSLLSSPGVGVDSSPHPLVAIVTDIAKLVAQILSSDWTLFGHFESITSQYFIILQKYSSLPQPPVQLLAACVHCLAVMTKNNSSLVWDKLRRTGFLPYISGPITGVDRVPVAPGHFGYILNTWERTRGVYAVTMGMLDLLISLCEGGGAVEAGSVLACVVWVCEEVMATCQGWRHRTRSGKEELAYKLLLLCHNILKKSKIDRVGAYVAHFLLHTHGHRTLISTLSLGVHTVNRLLSNQQGSPPVQVESLKLAFQLISTLLQPKTPELEPTALEHALTTQSLKLDTPTEGQSTRVVHLVSVIASYIHHHDDPLVPIGATKLLTRLSLVSPMSMFACLGQLATPIRDAFVSRLESRVEEVELKAAIVDLVRVCVQMQPGMAELFLCVRHTQGEYSLEKSSCLNAVLSIVKRQTEAKAPPLALTEAAAGLLSSLWEGRHDAALFALRRQQKFWEDLSDPLLSDRSSLLVVAKVMSIVTMETYYTVKSQLDKELLEVVEKLGPKVVYWIKVLCGDRQGTLELAKALSLLLLVVCSSPDTRHLFKDSSLRCDILNELLHSLHAQLTKPTPDVALATELSMLYLVLFRKWSHDMIKRNNYNDALSVVSQVLLSMPSELARPLYSIAMLALQTARNHKEGLEPRYCTALIPCIADTVQNCSDQGSKVEVAAVYVLNEIVHSFTPDNWLRPLQHHSVITILVRRVDHLLAQLSGCEFVEATLVLCLGLARHKEGAESLLLNEINHTLCISLTRLVSAPDTRQWKEVWLLVLRLTTQLLHTLGHQFLSNALDFVGVHQERLAMGLDLFQAVKDLPSLQETVAVCRFFLTLSYFRARWQFILPNLLTSLLEHLVALATGAVTILNKRAILKHIIKTMYSAGLLPPDVGPVTITTRRRSVGRSVSLDQSQLDDSAVTSCPAFVQLQDSLVSILMSSLYALRHFSPPLDAMILDGVLDLVEYPSLFTLSLAPPMLDNTTPSPLGTLTTCLTTVLALLNKVDPGSPTKSLSLSRSQSSVEKRAGLVCLLEQAVFLLLSQATRFLVDPSLDDHDKQLLKKELGSELSTFLKSLLLNFSRKGAPSPGRVATPSRSHSHLTDGGSSGKHSSLVFNEEQGMFRLADGFVQQFLR